MAQAKQFKIVAGRLAKMLLPLDIDGAFTTRCHKGKVHTKTASQVNQRPVAPFRQGIHDFILIACSLLAGALLH